MRILGFEWDDANLDHIARHGVDAEEVEETLVARPVIRRTHHGYYLWFGQSEAGLHLTVVVTVKAGGIARVITARDMSKREKKSYRHQTRS